MKALEVLKSRRAWATVLSLGAAGFALHEGAISAAAFAEWVERTLEVYVGAVAAEHFAQGIAAALRREKGPAEP